MVHKPLSKELVDSLRGIANSRFKNAVKRKFMRLKNVDHRKNVGEEKKFQDYVSNAKFEDMHKKFEFVCKAWGFRVRELNVSKKYPFLRKVIIKAVHSLPLVNTKLDAFELAAEIRSRVKEANKCAKKNSKWLVKEPFIYPLSEDFIAMAKTSYPSIKQIIEKQSDKRFIRKFEKKNKISYNEFLKMSDEVSKAMDLYKGNILFVGKEKGKFVFIPLADIY